MKKSIKILVVISGCLIAFMWATYALFHGFFDHGTFEVKQSRWSTSKQLAVVGRRSDHQAMSGDQYFVAIGDHQFSSADLRHAYYYDGVVFRAGSDCLTIQWMTDHELVVKCTDHSIQADQIAVQKTQIGGVTVLYENIPSTVSK